MNKKLMIIPTIVLSSTLLLTGCTSGNSENGNKSGTKTSSSPSSSSSPNDTPSESAIVEGYVAPPKDLDQKYQNYYFSPQTDMVDVAEYYKSLGVTTYKDDSSTRSLSPKEWDATKSDEKKFAKVYGEVVTDVEQSARNISMFLEKNPSATLDEIKNNKELVINRYDKAGRTVVEKDSKTGFYFVIFSVIDGKEGQGYGILVPQKGITPDFNAATR